MTNPADPSGKARREFLRRLGGAAIACTGSLAGAGALGLAQSAPAKNAPTAGAASFPTKDYDWTKHRWAFGVDATKCIGCLRCVDACKTENNVPRDANHFNTWVERYVYLEGEDRPRIDSHHDPVNIKASGSEREYRFANRYKNAKVDKAFFVPKLCNQCSNPPCVQVCPTGATFKTKDRVVLIDEKYCIGCQYCVQACPYGARWFNAKKGVSQKCYWCYHRITKGLQPACVEACPVGARIFGDRNDRQSPIKIFMRNNKYRVQVLRPETGNEPNVYYIGLDSEVA